MLASRQEGSAYAFLAHAQVFKPESRVLGFKLHFAVCRFCSAAGEQPLFETEKAFEIHPKPQGVFLGFKPFNFEWGGRVGEGGAERRKLLKPLKGGFEGFKGGFKGVLGWPLCFASCFDLCIQRKPSGFSAHDRLLGTNA